MIVKDIDELCRKNGIDYYLFGGSAIGAIRHKGFIPWDDDLDIIMDHNNYNRFVSVCRAQLDNEKYYFQEGQVDWPMLFSKIRLRGTRFEEPGSYADDNDEKGIFVDVFKLDNAPDNLLLKRWQYVCGKYLLCYCLLRRGYKEASLTKKILMILAYPLKIGVIRNYFCNQLVKYNNQETEEFVSFGSRFRFSTSYYRKALYSKPIYVPFEDTTLPVPEKYDELLTNIYGDYMTPPPKTEQQGWHMINVDFGKY